MWRDGNLIPTAASARAWRREKTWRGIVIPAGGQTYFTNAWVCLNMLRRSGCTLPVEFWYLGPSEFENHGERVVRGQRMDQVAPDVFLSWQRNRRLDGKAHDFYIRQLWDWKASIDLSTMNYAGLHAYARACGWSLARAQARSGDRLAIAAYLGRGPNFDRAIASFSAAYADQNELDHQRLAKAVDAGEIAALQGV